MRRLLLPALVLGIAACGGSPRLETRTFVLNSMMSSAAMELLQPYVSPDHGSISVAGRLLSVRDTRASLERIEQVLYEHDRPAANIQLQFQLIRANGAGPNDSAIGAIEAQLRRLFRFRGYRLMAQASTVSSGQSEFRVRMTSGSAIYAIDGGLEDVRVSGDSGSARLTVNLGSTEYGQILNTRLNIRLGHTAVLGGQPVGQAGALILAVRADKEVNP